MKDEKKDMEKEDEEGDNKMLSGVFSYAPSRSFMCIV
jgi:hypothetical protein